MDPVYGRYITVYEDELPLVNSPPFQRLRRVHQLGMSSHVYPMATHTRFAHSLGVMYLAGEFAETLGLDERTVKAYRVAGLLHDIGHTPFSHSIEGLMERELGFDHEDRSCALIEEKLAPLLPEGVSASEVKDIIRGDSQYNIVHGDVDVDRIDYLLRDSHSTGVKHGEFDAMTLIRFARLHDGKIVFSQKAIPALEGLFAARSQMNRSVYEHHTSKIIESMLTLAVDNYLQTEDVTMEEIANDDDHQLHSRLLHIAEWAVDETGKIEYEFDNEAPRYSRLYSRIVTRDLYKRAIWLTPIEVPIDELKRITRKIADPGTTAHAIADDCGLPDDAVLVDVPDIPAKQPLDVHILINESVLLFEDVSPVPKTFMDASWRGAAIGVYAPEEHVEAVRSAALDRLLS
jgi:HD superfamily phosphohydrolase